MSLGIDAIDICTDILECMLTHEILDVTQDDEHVQAQTPYIISSYH